MQILKFLKQLLIVALLCAAIALLFSFHLYLPSTKEKLGERSAADYAEMFASSYKVFSFTFIGNSIDKAMECAEDLYNKEVAEGKTEEEFEGTTVLDYFNKVLNNPDYEDKLTAQDHLAIFIPVLFAILAIIALVQSISIGLGTIRRLCFDNEATSFNDKK